LNGQYQEDLLPSLDYPLKDLLALSIGPVAKRKPQEDPMLAQVIPARQRGFVQ
jgi:hypothetical protein